MGILGISEIRGTNMSEIHYVNDELIALFMPYISRFSNVVKILVYEISRVTIKDFNYYTNNAIYMNL